MHSGINKLASLLLLALFFNSGVMAQERPRKKEAPQTRIDLPGDSSKVRRDSVTTARKKTQQKPEEGLKLPDVLVFGKNDERYVGGKKITISRDQVDLLNPAAIYQPVEADLLSADTRAQAGAKEKAKPRRADGSAHSGMFGQFGFTGRWWEARDTFDYGLDLHYLRTGGEFENSEHRDVQGKFQFGTYFDRDGRWQVGLQHINRRYGLYGANQASTDREHLATQIQGSARFVPRSMPVKFRVEGAFTTATLTDLPAIENAPVIENRNTTFDLLASAEREITKGSLMLSGRVVKDLVEDEARKISDVTYQLWDAGLRYAFTPDFKLQTGIQISTASFPDTTHTRMRPYGRIIWIPGGDFVLTLSGSSGLTYQSWRDVAEHNPYLAFVVGGWTEELLWAGTINAEWGVTSTLSVFAEYDQRRIDGYHFFERNVDGLFEDFTAPVELAEMRGGLRRALNDRLTLEASYSYLADAIEGTEKYDYDAVVPYRAQSLLPVSLTWQATPKLKLESEATWVGVRRPAVASVRELDAYVHVEARAGYSMNRHVEIFARAANVLNEAYQVWDGYRALSTYVIGGLSAVW